MKKIIILFLSLLVNVFAQDAGTTGMAFLKNPFTARNTAMGDIGNIRNVSIADAYYNPASLAYIQQNEILFSNISWFGDVNSAQFAAGSDFIGIPLMIGVNSTSIKGFEVREVPGNPLSSFDIHYFSGFLTSGFTLTENIAVGATFKFLYEEIFSDDADGYAFDLGASYSEIVEGLNAGISIRNLGGMSKLRNEETKLPADMQLSADYKFKTGDFDFNLLAGYRKFFEEDDSHLHLGTEVTILQFAVIRLGYVTGYEAKDISTGLGLNYKGIKVDYSFQKIGYGLGDSHGFGLSYNF